jgi:hypothetical protein
LRRVLIVLLGCIAFQMLSVSTEAYAAEDNAETKELFPPGFPFSEPAGDMRPPEAAQESNEEAPSRENRASKAVPSQEPADEGSRSSAGSSRRVISTAYCHTGVMASGKRTYVGAAAMNGAPLGTSYQVLDGPRAGETFVIEDRIGGGSSFDIAYPGNCEGARRYGRRSIFIRRVW